MSKKELKDMVNSKGGFITSILEISVNAPESMQSRVPEGAIYFEGLASNGDLNRNGYKIRPEAWKKAISSYMENPVILLQHNQDKLIGHCLDAYVDNEGLHVAGYVFDEYTDGKFSKGLYKALSTGHITLDVEFEEKETGKVITEEEFRAINSWDKYDNYVMCVTALDFLEWSIVALPSNKKGLISHRNAIIGYLQNEEEVIETPQPVTPVNPTPVPDTKTEEPKPKEEEKTTDNTAPAADPANSSPGNPVATPESVKQTDEEKAKDPAQGGAGTTPATNALNTPSLTVDEMKDALQKLYFQVMDQEGIIQAQETELNSLRQKLNQPVKKSFVTIPGQFAENKKTTGLAELLRSKGLGK